MKGRPLRWRRGHNPKTVRISFAERFAQHVVCHGDPDACWPWTGSGYHDGYGRTRVSDKDARAHIETYRFFKGEIPLGLLVRHTCDQRRCCNPRHLIVGTRDDNMADMVARERQARGHGIHSAILTDDIVRAIRAAYTGARGEHTQLARQYGVSRSNISMIIARRTWKHV